MTAHLAEVIGVDRIRKLVIVNIIGKMPFGSDWNTSIVFLVWVSIKYLWRNSALSLCRYIVPAFTNKCFQCSCDRPCRQIRIQYTNPFFKTCLILDPDQNPVAVVSTIWLCCVFLKLLHKNNELILVYAAFYPRNYLQNCLISPLKKQGEGFNFLALLIPCQ